MRKLTWLLITLTVLWSGGWFWGSSQVRGAIDQWFADQTAQGYIAENAGFSVLGFPNRIDITIDSPKFADPATGFGWEGAFLQTFTMGWKPWHVIAALPPQQTIRTPGQDIGITATGLRASARARPELILPLDEAIVEGAQIKITSSEGWSVGLATLLAAIRADQGTPNAYDLALTASDIEPDRAFQTALATAGASLPQRITSLRADLKATLTAPLDRNLTETRPRLAALDVTEVAVAWGELSFFAKGRIEPDAAGYASGTVEIAVTNWQRLVPVLVAAGVVTPEVAPTVDNMLKAMAEQNGSPFVLELPLTLASGRMALGPLPLGPAPLMVPPTN